ncbi:MAG: hypothetical protein NWE91_08260 [Candidatus Bathyarchaeota archaeon]|nr:hypothetical protein [Candidatus Bathyarchaeota archaeon]
MKTSLSKTKLFGIRKTLPQTIAPSSSINIAVTQHNNCSIEKAKFEAEHKKAQAITISRRYIFR